MKSYMMFLGGAPLPSSCFIHQAQTCHRIAFCEVTKLADSLQDQGLGQPGTSEYD